MTDAVVFAGGRGSRVSEILPPGTPKFLADINGRPFCELLFDQLRGLKVSHVTLVLGHHRDAIIDYIGRNADPAFVSWCVAEGSPEFLYEAAKPGIASNPIWVVNGDTIITFRPLIHKPNSAAFYFGNTFAGWKLLSHRDAWNECVPVQCDGFIDIGTPEGLAELREKMADDQRTHTVSD